MADRVVAARRIAELVGDFDRSPAYQGLAEGLRVLITDGRVPVGVRLPSERELTEALGVSRTTVTRAYAELRDRGFLVSRQGSGSVASLPATHGLRGDHLLTPNEQAEGKIDLTCAAPVPGAGLLAAYQRAVADLPRYLSGSGYYPSGLPELRQAVADRYAARGLPTTADQVMIVPGAMSGLAVAARALVRRGARAVVESPTYPNGIETLRHSGARLVSSHVARDDARVDALIDVVRQVGPALALLIPDFHNPTGHLMSDESREQVAAALGRAGATPVIDESMVDIPLDGQAMPAPFAAYSPGAVSVGSLSKPFWGGLRVGWVRAPEPMMDALVRSRLSLDLGTPLLEQLVAIDLLDHGAPLLEQRRAQLRASRDAALAALAVHLPEWQVHKPGGGLSLWCELPEDKAHSSDLVPYAAGRDVIVVPGPSFAPEGGLDRFLRIPYTAPAHVLEDAIGRLAVAWRDAPRGLMAGRVRQDGPTLVA
ncbi:MAG TPA: PLP-dependent aminotransferase family protein [Marmoricola sp.]|nr:PLP-dependent aminotransferase family protein [Marmoricola sp.]